jgi:hypothetical protein
VILRTNHRLRWPLAFPGLLADCLKGQQHDSAIPPRWDRRDRRDRKSRGREAVPPVSAS